MIEEFVGLRIAVVDVDRALAGALPSALGGIDVVRVREPAAAAREALVEAGFVVKPTRVTWVAQALESEAAFLARLSRIERQTIARGRRALDDLGVTIGDPAPLTPAGLDDFLRLYQQQIDGMRHGVSFAGRDRDSMVEQRDDYLVVEARAGSELVGGCVCLLRADRSTLQIRFSAVDPRIRQDSVVRLLYLHAFQRARELGLGSLSLGSDPTLYGHIAKPGLFRFKKRLGFVPVPSQAFVPGFGGDEADLVLRLDALDDPSLLLGYARPGPAREDAAGADVPGLVEAAVTAAPLRLEVLSRDPGIDLRPYRAAFLGDVRARRMPG